MPANKPVIQTDLQGNIIKEFPSPERAVRDLGVKSKLIMENLKGISKSVLGKWKFAYKKEEVVPPLDPAPVTAPITVEDPVIEPDPNKSALKPEDPEDRWLTPFEKILKRRKK